MVKFDETMIAPCGMNCGSCIVNLRQSSKCYGCRSNTSKLKTRANCSIKTCEELKKTSSGFCFDCTSFPCKRLKQLDKRYRTRYNTSFINDLSVIKEKGLQEYIRFETDRRTCPTCGSVISVHRNNCLSCSYQKNPDQKINK